MKQCPMLMYHWFRAEGSRSRSRSPQLEITPGAFAEQMEYLAGAGYRTVSIETALGLRAHPAAAEDLQRGELAGLILASQKDLSHAPSLALT